MVLITLTGAFTLTGATAHHIDFDKIMHDMLSHRLIVFYSVRVMAVDTRSDLHIYLQCFEAA